MAQKQRKTQAAHQKWSGKSSPRVSGSITAARMIRIISLIDVATGKTPSIFRPPRDLTIHVCMNSTFRDSTVESSNLLSPKTPHEMFAPASNMSVSKKSFCFESEIQCCKPCNKNAARTNNETRTIANYRSHASSTSVNRYLPDKLQIVIFPARGFSHLRIYKKC